MPDGANNFKGISVPRLWPGHPDYEEPFVRCSCGWTGPSWEHARHHLVEAEDLRVHEVTRSTPETYMEAEGPDGE